MTSAAASATQPPYRVTRRAFVRAGGALAVWALGCGATPATQRDTRRQMTGTTTTGAATLSPFARETPPLVFVHGNGDSAALWLTQLWRCESQGYPRERLHALDFPNPTARDDDTVPQPNRSGSDEQRDQLAAYVAGVLARTGAARVALIGSSRGGNAIRNYLCCGDGAAWVSHAVLCGTPNHGVVSVPGSNNEFNGQGSFLRRLNVDEVIPGVAYLTLRSDRLDKFAQPFLASGQPSGVDYDSPALRGATNVVLDGLDHREVAFHPRAFAAFYPFITGQAPATLAIVPEAAPRLAGRVTGLAGNLPTNAGVAWVTVTIYEVDPASGARRGPAVFATTTGDDGAWGPCTTRPDAYHEFVVEAPGQPTRHFFRTPFPRSTAVIALRLGPDEAAPGRGVVIFTRPRGYVADGRDRHLPAGQPLPGVKAGVPVDSAFRVMLGDQERPVPVVLNDESMTVRAIPGAVVYAEFHY